MAPVAHGMEKRPCYRRMVGRCTWDMSPGPCVPRNIPLFPWQEGDDAQGMHTWCGTGDTSLFTQQEGADGTSPKAHVPGHIPAPVGELWSLCCGDTSTGATAHMGRAPNGTWCWGHVPALMGGRDSARGAHGQWHVSWRMSLLSSGGGTVDMGHIPDARCCWDMSLLCRWEGWCCGMSQGTRPCSCGTVHVGCVTVNTTP